jgi:hypothetical protein
LDFIALAMALGVPAVGIVLAQVEEMKLGKNVPSARGIVMVSGRACGGVSKCNTVFGFVDRSVL